MRIHLPSVSPLPNQKTSTHSMHNHIWCSLGAGPAVRVPGGTSEGWRERRKGCEGVNPLIKRRAEEQFILLRDHTRGLDLYRDKDKEREGGEEMEREGEKAERGEEESRYNGMWESEWETERGWKERDIEREWRRERESWIKRGFDGMIYSAFGKVFRPLYFFHILLHYSLILKLIKYICFLISLHTIPHNDKAKKGFYNLLQMYKK